MSRARSYRMAWLLAIAVVALGFGIALIKVFNSNLVFFYTPSQILQGEIPQALQGYRLGGMVQPGSVQREPDSLRVQFIVTDQASAVPVVYTGILPDMFKEGTGVVADGHWNGSLFTASEVLAKHDEAYMPPGVQQ